MPESGPDTSKSASPPGHSEGGFPNKVPPRARRVCLFAAATVVCYALTLCLLSDSFFLLAFPGLIGGFVLIVFAVQGVLHGMPRSSSGAPYATDGTDGRGAVKYHYMVLARRYTLIVVSAAVLFAGGTATDAPFLFPLAGMGGCSVLAALYLRFGDAVRASRACWPCINSTPGAGRTTPPCPAPWASWWQSSPQMPYCTGTYPARDFRLGLSLVADVTLRVEVVDARGEVGLPVGALRPPAASDAETGRGLALVAALADRWGVTWQTRPCKTVWAELDLAAR